MTEFRVIPAQNRKAQKDIEKCKVQKYKGASCICKDAGGWSFFVSEKKKNFHKRCLAEINKLL